MGSRVLFLFIVMLVWGVFRATAWSQAAAEYGAAAGAAAAATGKATSMVNEAIKQVGGPAPSKTPEAPPNPPAPFATKSLETVMKENKEKLEAQAQQGGATLRIDSVPAKATVTVDGSMVGYTPVELKLATGQHLIELKQFDSMPWRKEVSLSAGETLSLKPELQYKYQSVINLSGK